MTCGVDTMLWQPCEYLQYATLPGANYSAVVKQRQVSQQRRQLRNGRRRGTREAKTISRTDNRQLRSQ